MGAHAVGDYIMILLAIVVRFGLAELNFKLTNSCFPSGFGYVAEYHIVCYPRNSFSFKESASFSESSAISSERKFAVYKEHN